MKSILIASLGLALSTATFADNNLKTLPSFVYSKGSVVPATQLSYDLGEFSTTALIAADGTMLARGSQTKVTGPDLTTWGWSYYYDIKQRESAIVVTKPIFLATNLFGVKNLNMSVEAFGGVGLESGKLLGGAAGIFKGKIADQIWLGVGPGVTAQDNRPLGFGVLGQVQVKF